MASTMSRPRRFDLAWFNADRQAQTASLQGCGSRMARRADLRMAPLQSPSLEKERQVRQVCYVVLGTMEEIEMKVALLARALVWLVLACAVGATPALASPFTGLYVFGDSLSDVGNVFL